MYFKFPVPHPLSSRKINKKAIKLPSYRYLPTPNVSFSPSFLHFRPDFTFLPTFSGHFFPPAYSVPLHSLRPSWSRARTTGFCQTFHIGCSKLELGRNGDEVIFVGGGGNSSWHGQLRLCGSSWKCDSYKRITENKENAFQIPLFKNILKCKTRQNDFKMPSEGSWLWNTQHKRWVIFIWNLFKKRNSEHIYFLCSHKFCLIKWKFGTNSLRAWAACVY